MVPWRSLGSSKYHLLQPIIKAKSPKFVFILMQSNKVFFLLQIFIVKAPVLDVKRLITLAAFGFLYHGPSGHYFYNFLDEKIPGTDPKAVASKVLVDQVLWCPLFMIVFFTYLGLVAGDSFGVIGNKIKSDLFLAVQGSWKVWPIVHAVNFKFISTKHRLVFINGIQIAFNMFLSLLGSK
jgi:protein Mpv17